MDNKIIGLSALIIASFIIIAIFGRKQRNRKTKIWMLVLADVLFSVFFMFYHDDESKEIILIAFIIVLNILAIRKIIISQTQDQEKYNAWHDDPANWKLGVFYFNPKDNRIFPPKKIESFGWTVNFANPCSILAPIGIILLIFALKSMMS